MFKLAYIYIGKWSHHGNAARHKHPAVLDSCGPGYRCRPKVMRDLIALGAALRLTRLVTRDWLGEWTIVQPAKAWARKHDGPVDVHSQVAQDVGVNLWRTKAVSGLDCPHCVSFWLTLTCLVFSRINLPQPAAQLRDLVLKALAGSYVVGHASSRIDT